MLAWEKELLGVYLSEHPFRAVASDLAGYTTHSLSDLTMEMVGQSAVVAGLVARLQSRLTRDGRKFYIVDVEDLSGTVELTVWNDTIEQTGEAIWAEGQRAVAHVECRDRGDRLSLNVRKAAPYDRGDGTVVGFARSSGRCTRRRRRGADQPAARLRRQLHRSMAQPSRVQRPVLSHRRQPRKVRVRAFSRP